MYVSGVAWISINIQWQVNFIIVDLLHNFEINIIDNIMN